MVYYIYIATLYIIYHIYVYILGTRPSISDKMRLKRNRAIAIIIVPKVFCFAGFAHFFLKRFFLFIPTENISNVSC